MVSLSISPACKRTPPPEEVPPPVAGPAAPPRDVPVEAIDALNPPPPVVVRQDLAVRADTVNGDPNGPKRADLDAAQAEAQRKVQTCLDGLAAAALPGGSVRLVVKYSVGNDGKMRDVVIEGGGSAEATACGKNAIESVTVPKYEGAIVSSSISLNYSRPQPPDLGTKK